MKDNVNKVDFRRKEDLARLMVFGICRDLDSSLFLGCVWFLEWTGMSRVGPVLGPSSHVWFVGGMVTNSFPHTEYSAQTQNQVEPPNRADDVEPSPSSHSCLPQTLLTVTSAASPRLPPSPICSAALIPSKPRRRLILLFSLDLQHHTGVTDRAELLSRSAAAWRRSCSGAAV